MVFMNEALALIDRMVGKPTDLFDVFTTQKRRLPMTVNETETGFEYQLIAPGIPRNELEIEVKGRRIGLSYVAKEDTKSVIPYASFDYTWQVPNDADLESIEARSLDGILTIKVPKLASVVHSRKIEIAG